MLRVAAFPTARHRIYLTLAEKAQQAHAYLDAELLYYSALANLPAQADDEVASDERFNQAIKGRALMRFRVGRWDDALRDFEAARDRAQETKRCGNGGRRRPARPGGGARLDGRDRAIRQRPSTTPRPLPITWKTSGSQRGSRLHAGAFSTGEAQLEQSLSSSSKRRHKPNAWAKEGYETFVIALALGGPDCVGLGPYRGSRADVGSRHRRLRSNTAITTTWRRLSTTASSFGWREPN